MRVDQAELETVIPQPGGAVLVVGGAHRGARATLQDIDTANYRAQVGMNSGGRARSGRYEQAPQGVCESSCLLERSLAAAAAAPRIPAHSLE